MLFFYIKGIRDFHGINAAKAAEGDALIDVVHFDAVRDVVFHQNVEDTLFFSRGGYGDAFCHSNHRHAPF